MNKETVAINACAAISMASDSEKAKIIHSTLRYVEQVIALRVPASVSRYILQAGCATRVTTLKQVVEEIRLSLNAVRQTSQNADVLLKLRPDEWYGGNFDTVP